MVNAKIIIVALFFLVISSCSSNSMSEEDQIRLNYDEGINFIIIKNIQKQKIHLNMLFCILWVLD